MGSTGSPSGCEINEADQSLSGLQNQLRRWMENQELNFDLENHLSQPGRKNENPVGFIQIVRKEIKTLWPKRNGPSRCVATICNRGYNSLLRNFLSEIPRKFAIFLHGENPGGFSRNEIIAEDVVQHFEKHIRHTICWKEKNQ